MGDWGEYDHKMATRLSMSPVDYSGGNINLTQLPAVPLANIFSFLEKNDLSRCCLVCRRFNAIASGSNSWKTWCCDVWCATICPPGKSWKEYYYELYRVWGRYEDCYANIRRAWNAIEKFTKEFCPDIFTSLKSGVTEDELDKVEEHSLNGYSLPDDLRCSLRIHNGQRLVGPGLIGSMSISNHYQSESLLDLALMSNGLQHREGLRGCIPISFCVHTGNGQFLALSSESRHRPGEIFWPRPDQAIDYLQLAPIRMNYFKSATSFTEWLCDFAGHLSQKMYPLINSEIYKFILCGVAVTEGITVKTTTAFLPELSSINPPLFFFTYRISVSMDQNCSMMNKCQLTTRHWLITDGNGIREEVHGEGVVGENPIMSPGALHEYISCTTFTTPTGMMEGHYEFKFLKKPGHCQVRIPTMKFESLPFIKGEEMSD